jgi:hypothetical protein
VLPDRWRPLSGFVAAFCAAMAVGAQVIAGFTGTPSLTQLIYLILAMVFALGSGAVTPEPIKKNSRWRDFLGSVNLGEFDFM